MITVKHKSQVGNLDLSSLNTPDTPPRAQPAAGRGEAQTLLVALHTSCHDQAAVAPDGELCFKQTLLINSPGGTVCQARGGLPFALGLLQLMMLSEKLKLMFTINFGEQLSWAGNSQQLEPGSCSWAAGSWLWLIFARLRWAAHCRSRHRGISMHISSCGWLALTALMLASDMFNWS